MKTCESILETIGNTPLVHLKGFEEANQIQTKIYGKVEYFNPGGSVKDRVAYQMLTDALNDGKINQDTIIIEPTSGNTGIGLAMACAAMKLKLIIVMPDSMSVERINTMQAYGADVILTTGKLGMKGAIEKAYALREKYVNSFIPSQFDNPSNPLVHYKRTAVEIYEQMSGSIDILVAGIGTGGTISGIGKYLKEKNPNLKIIGVEPLSSPVISKGISGPHKIQGIGAGFIPKNLNQTIYDEIIMCSNDDAFTYARMLPKTDGILVGISSGAALYAAKLVSERSENAGLKIVVILPDNGQRYMSTELFSE